VNDVFFCAQDIVRLLQYKAADMACGLDFQRYRRHGRALAAAPATGPLSTAPEEEQPGLLRTPLEYLGTEADWARNGSSSSSSSSTRKLMSSWHYYDVWVGRDIGGQMISSHNPYIRHEGSRNRFRQGWPIPVHSCWNGLAVMNAAPFTRHNLRFRAGVEVKDECRASECSIIGFDFMRLGYGKFLLDPSVRMMYTVEGSAVHGGFDVPMRSLAEVQAQHDKDGMSKGGDPVGAFWEPAVVAKHALTPSSTISCCGTDAKGELDWRSWSSCAPLDVMGGRNFTGEFLTYLQQQLATPEGKLQWVGER